MKINKDAFNNLNIRKLSKQDDPAQNDYPVDDLKFDAQGPDLVDDPEFQDFQNKLYTVLLSEDRERPAGNLKYDPNKARPASAAKNFSPNRENRQRPASAAKEQRFVRSGERPVSAAKEQHFVSSGEKPQSAVYEFKAKPVVVEGADSIEAPMNLTGGEEYKPVAPVAAADTQLAEIAAGSVGAGVADRSKDGIKSRKTIVHKDNFRAVVNSKAGAGGKSGVAGKTAAGEKASTNGKTGASSKNTGTAKAGGNGKTGSGNRPKAAGKAKKPAKSGGNGGFKGFKGFSKSWIQTLLLIELAFVITIVAAVFIHGGGYGRNDNGTPTGKNDQTVEQADNGTADNAQDNTADNTADTGSDNAGENASDGAEGNTGAESADNTADNAANNAGNNANGTGTVAGQTEGFTLAAACHDFERRAIGDETTDADSPVVKVAREQLGNYGGDPYWSWYGFDYHVAWCAVFVSWVGNETGYLQDGKIPRYAVVDDGEYFYKNKGLWLEPGERPQGGDIVFFDKNLDGYIDHTGIVSGTLDDRVFTIEGNTGFAEHGQDTDQESEEWLGICWRRGYQLDDPRLYGYGMVDHE